jgi:recombination protein RecT
MARQAAATKEKTDAPAAQMADASNAGKEMTVSNGAPPSGPKTVAQENKEKLKKVIAELAKRAEDYQPLLAAHNIPWDVFTAIIQQALIKVPFTLKCTTASILQACMRAAADGLLPDGDECALVPFKNTQINAYEATYVPGYKGMLKCAYAMHDGTGAKVYQDVDLDVIYEGEEGFFKVRKGTDPSLTFEPPLNRDINKPVIGAYAVVRTNNGGVFVEVIGQMELAKIANVSKAKSGPRSTWGAEMHKKGPLRRLLKRTPKDQRLTRLIAHDEEAYLPDAASVVDGDATDIPDTALFDDIAHHVADAGPDEDALRRSRMEAAQAQARADMMESDTEEKLDAVIAKIEEAADYFGSEITAALLENAESLRMARFGGSMGGGEDSGATEGDAEDQEAGDVVTQPSTDTSSGESPSETATTTAPTSPTEGSSERPTETASAPSAAPSPDSSASATDASTGSPAATSTPGAPANKSPAGAAPRWKEAPADRRMTPAQLMLEGEEVGAHFKAGIAPNANGQVPYFNGNDEIIGWGKPDLDIPTLQAGEILSHGKNETVIVGTIGVGADKQMDAADLPQVRTNPEDRQDPQAAAQPDPKSEPSAQPDDDDGYGEEESPKLRIKSHPEKPAIEYRDAVEWKDAVIFKMGALRPKQLSLQRWWADNRPFVEEALKINPKVAGRVVTQAVVDKLDGAGDLVAQYGPF